MTTTLNAPPDQINGGLTLGDGTTLNVGEGGTVSGIAVEPGAVVNVNGGAASNISVNGTFNHGGTINVNGGTASGTTVNGTLNLNDGKITGTTLNEFGTLNLNGGTAVNTLIIDTGVMNVSGGIIDGISFDLSPNQSSYELQLNDFSSVQGPLGFDAPGLHSGPVGHYKVSLDFKHDDPSASVTLTRQTQTITIDYGQNQSVTYHYTTNKFTSVAAVALLHEHHQIELIVDVLVVAGPAPAFSAQSAATLVYTAEFGSAPDATELTILNQFTQAQFDFGQKIGVMDPSIYAFQALGVALASGPHFQDTFGPTNVLYPVSTVGDVHFVDDSYASVFGHTGSAAQIQQFVDQLGSFEALYTAAGTFGSASNIDLLARGAIYGQMLGIEHESAPVGIEPGGTTFTAPPDQHGLILNAGDILDVNKGGKAFDTTINDGGVVNVNDGGVASSTTVNSGGVENINAHGSGDATINAGGVVNVADKADSGSTILAGGVENVSFGGHSQEASIQGGVENVELGGRVTDVLFSAGVLKLADPKGLDGTMSLEGFPKKGLVIDFENTQVTHAEIHETQVELFNLILTFGDDSQNLYHVQSEPRSGFGIFLALQPDGQGGTNLIITDEAPVQSSTGLIGVQHDLEQLAV